MYTYNEQYKILKAYDARSFILGLKEVCNINIDLEKSYIGSMFNYQLVVDDEIVILYDRTTFMDWICSKVDVMKDNGRSYLTSLDYQLTLNSEPVKTKKETVVDSKVEDVQEEQENTEQTTKKPRGRKTAK